MLEELFPDAPEGVFTHTHGHIDLPIGPDQGILHPKGGIDIGNFRLVESVFGCGAILTDSKNGAYAREWTSEIAFSMMHPQPISPFLSTEEQNNIPQFYEAEDLGYCPPSSAMIAKCSLPAD